MTLSYHITTFGCQMNQHDSEMMEGTLAGRGWRRAADEAAADLILYNTCVVREHAEERALNRLTQLGRLKRERPGRIIGVTGCMAQKDAEALRRRLPHVDLVLGTRAIPRLGPLLDKILATGQPQVCVEILDEPFPPDVQPVRQRPLKGLINIILGCNKNCAYCIVPRTRGREASYPPEAIAAEARRMIEAGYREITLVGQNVNAYRGWTAAGESWISAACCGGWTLWPRGLVCVTSPPIRGIATKRTFPPWPSRPTSARTSTCPCSRGQPPFCGGCIGATRGSAISG